MTWLFRGKWLGNKLNGKTGDWIYGDLIHRTEGRVSICDNNQDWYEVDKNSVGIWTGEEATNGKIFQGDRVFCDFDNYHYEGVVKFEKGCFYVYNEKDDTSYSLDFSDEPINEVWTITGNIHEGEVGE